MKTVLITGVSSGIGRAAAKEFLRRGDRVIGSARNPDSVKDLQTQNFILWKCDFLNLKEVESITPFLKEHSISQIDVLVNNAGIALAGPFELQNFSEVENTLTTNVLSLMRLTQLAIPFLIPTQGRIINISSVSGVEGTPFLGVYCASKHAVEGFSEALRLEMQIHGIKVSVIGPGSIKTPIWSKGITDAHVTYQNSVYKNSFQRFIAFAQNEEKNGLPVEAVVKDILHAARSKCPKVRYAPIPRYWVIARFIPKIIMTRIKSKALGLNIKKN